MMDKYFVAYESYDAKILESLCGDGDVKGIILGDALCNKRMFRGGISELVLMMNRVLYQQFLQQNSFQKRLKIKKLEVQIEKFS